MTEQGSLVRIRPFNLYGEETTARTTATGEFIFDEEFGYFEDLVYDELSLPANFEVEGFHFDAAPGGRMLFFYSNGQDTKGGFWTEDGQLVSFEHADGPIDKFHGEVNASGYAAASAHFSSTHETPISLLVSPSGDVTEIFPPGITSWGPTGMSDFGSGIANVSNESSARAINSENAVVCAAKGMVYDPAVDDHYYRQWSFVTKNGVVVHDDLPYGATDINDHGEVVGFSNAETWIFLPQPKYGLTSGRHTILSAASNPHDRGVIPKINNAGAVVWTGNNARGTPQYWKDNQLFSLIDIVNTDEEFEILRVRDINDAGQIMIDDKTLKETNDGFTYDSFGSRILSGSSVRIDVEDADQLEPGQEFVATVTIQHAGLTPATYAFPEASEGIYLTASPDDRVEIMEADIPGAVVLSAAESSVSYQIRCKVLKKGLVVLRTEVSMMPEEGGGGTTILSDEHELFIDPLSVTLEMIPQVDGKPIVDVELVDDGEGNISVTDLDGNAVTPKIKVTIENQGPDPLNVFLQGVDPRSRDESPMAARIRTVGAFPIELGSMAGNTMVEREIDLEFSEDGRFEFSALVTAGLVGRTATTTKTVSGAPLAVGEPFPVGLELKVADTASIDERRNGAYFVQPGGTVHVIAAVDNRTSNATLHFKGMRAEKHLNALGGHLTSDDGNAVSPPFVHDHEVNANSSAILTGLVLTDTEGAPAGTVIWEGLEDMIIIDDATGDETELTMDDVLVTRGDGDKGWLGNDLSIRVIQNNALPEAPSEITWVRWGKVYSRGVMVGIGKWTYDTYDAIGGLGRLAGTVVGNPSLLADAWGESSRAVWEAAELAAGTWSEMSKEERQEFIAAVTPEISRRLALFTTTGAPVDLDDRKAVAQWIDNAVFSLMGGVTEAYASDDPEQIAAMWGLVSGQVGMEVVSAAIPGEKFTKYVKAADLTKLAKNQKLAKALTTQEKRLRAIKSGALDIETTRKVFGPGAQDVSRFMEVFKLFGVKGYARERAPISYRLIDELGEAIWKPENMKPKGFSELDGLIIGGDLPTLPGLKDPSRTLELKGITAIFMPEPDFRIRNRLRANGTPEYVIDAALSRAADRREEFQKFASKFNKWKDTEFSVAKNYLDNGVPDPSPLKTDKRDFDFDVIDLGPNRPQLRIPKLANIDGEIRYISGDIDWVHFSFLDGSPLDTDTAKKLYDALCRCCGVQHPETISWLRNGQSVFKAKANQITEYIRGQKALLELSEYGPRAVRVSERLTRFSTNNRLHLIFFDGGVKSRKRATLADIETVFAIVQRLYPRPIITPVLWYLRTDGSGDDTTINGNEWSYSTADGDEIILRQTSDGRTEQFNGSEWVEWTPPVAPAPDSAAPSGKGGNAAKSTPPPAAFDSPPADRISLAPTTALDRAVHAGSRVLEIVDLPDLWAEELEGRVDNWFEPGQTIIIAPGELTQEIHVVADIEPFKLEDKLKYDHGEGTIVAVLPANLTPAIPSDTDSELLSTTIGGDYVTLLWSSIPWALYSLEIADDAGQTSWSVVREGIFSDSVALGVTLGVDDYDADATYRLRYTGEAPSPVNFSSISLNPHEGTVTVEWVNEDEKEFLIEVSETMEPGSWGLALPELEIFGDVNRATLPLDTSAVPSRFYRARETGENFAGGGALQILGMTHDESESTLTITWAAEPGDTYVLEAKEHNGDQSWRSVADVVTATDFRVTLVLDVAPDSDPEIYRVREVDL